MSIGYSQMPTWLTTNSANQAYTQKTGTQKENNYSYNSTDSTKSTISHQLSQNSSSYMKEIFAAGNSYKDVKVKGDGSLKLPAVIDMDGVKVRTNNRSNNEVIQELSQKTGKSANQIKTELKRKYSNVSASLNLNA